MAIDYKEEFEKALEERDAAGWLGTTPAKTIRNQAIEIRDLQKQVREYQEMVR